MHDLPSLICLFKWSEFGVEIFSFFFTQKKPRRTSGLCSFVFWTFLIDLVLFSPDSYNNKEERVEKMSVNGICERKYQNGIIKTHVPDV